MPTLAMSSSCVSIQSMCSSVSSRISSRISRETKSRAASQAAMPSLSAACEPLFDLEVGGEHLLGVLADPELAEVLQVRQAVEHQDALDQLVGVLHLLDRLLVLDLAEALQPHWRYMRACRKYWLTAVSSRVSWAFRTG
jgi:hypothetical protein